MALRSLTQAAMVLVFMFDASWRLTVITFISIPCVILLCQVYGEYLRCAPGAARASGGGAALRRGGAAPAGLGLVLREPGRADVSIALLLVPASLRRPRAPPTRPACARTTRCRRARGAPGLG